MPKVNRKQVEGFCAPLPPKELQDEFAQFYKQVDKSKFELRQAIEKINSLIKSLIVKSPLRRIHKVKTCKTVKETYTDEALEIRLRTLGRKLNIHKAYPHKFRRTLVTMAIDKGMPIEQVQQLLGHQSIDTTLQYAMVNQANVKASHRKYIG